MGEKTGKKQLHYWYVDENTYHGETCYIGHGIVTGHERLSDSTFVHTSPIKSMIVDEDMRVLLLKTKNSEYQCPLEYCKFSEQDKHPDVIPQYEYLKEKYKDAMDYPSIEPGKVLLVLADFCDYYFHSLYYVPESSEDGKSVEYSGWPHIGMFQDSYLITTVAHEIDLRFFPHYRNIEFYSELTNGCPLFIENIGDSVLCAKTSAGTIKLNPGERKEVSKDNTEPDPPILPGGDLYPAAFIDNDVDMGGFSEIDQEEIVRLLESLQGKENQD